MSEQPEIKKSGAMMSWDEPDEEEKLKELFHVCWSNAVGAENYNKKKWMALQGELQKRGVDV